MLLTCAQRLTVLFPCTHAHTYLELALVFRAADDLVPQLASHVDVGVVAFLFAATDGTALTVLAVRHRPGEDTRLTEQVLVVTLTRLVQYHVTAKAIAGNTNERSWPTT